MSNFKGYILVPGDSHVNGVLTDAQVTAVLCRLNQSTVGSHSTKRERLQIYLDSKKLGLLSEVAFLAGEEIELYLWFPEQLK